MGVRLIAQPTLPTAGVWQRRCCGCGHRRAASLRPPAPDTRPGCTYSRTLVPLGAQAGLRCSTAGGGRGALPYRTVASRLTCPAPSLPRALTCPALPRPPPVGQLGGGAGHPAAGGGGAWAQRAHSHAVHGCAVHVARRHVCAQHRGGGAAWAAHGLGLPHAPRWVGGWGGGGGGGAGGQEKGARLRSCARLCRTLAMGI